MSRKTIEEGRTFADRASSTPSPTWRRKVQENRENTHTHHSSGIQELLLWQQGFGAVATARILDWYCACHPDNINAKKGGI